MAVVELNLGAQLQKVERENLVRLVSAFGGAASRCLEAASAKAAISRASTDLAVQTSARARFVARWATAALWSTRARSKRSG